MRGYYDSDAGPKVRLLAYMYDMDEDVVYRHVKNAAERISEEYMKRSIQSRERNNAD